MARGLSLEGLVAHAVILMPVRVADKPAIDLMVVLAQYGRGATLSVEGYRRTHRAEQSVPL